MTDKVSWSSWLIQQAMYRWSCIACDFEVVGTYDYILYQPCLDCGSHAWEAVELLSQVTPDDLRCPMCNNIEACGCTEEV